MGDDAPAASPQFLLQEQYGDHPEQFLRVYAPPIAATGEAEAPRAVAVVVHGGWWKNKFTIDNAAHNTLAPDLVRRGFIAVEIEYRRCDSEGGGHDGTQLDVLAAYGHLSSLASGRSGLPPMDLKHVMVFGHSAGGQLVLWLASHLSTDPSASPTPPPALVVGCAPCTDLIAGFDQKLSDDGNACELYMRCKPTDSDEALAKFKSVSPRWLPPPSMPVLVVCGEKDVDVPASLAREYAEVTSAAGCRVEGLFPAEADHFAVFAVGPTWEAMLATIDGMALGFPRLCSASC